ncbi:MAG: hypothetical protein Q8R02_23245 [Hyphomonadaceae bacterium]|nr:hypothetical protein [Hyphomonadaceae bacterium]
MSAVAPVHSPGMTRSKYNAKPRVIVCAGPPKCLLEDDEAIAAAKAGCKWCRRLTPEPEGRWAEEGPGHG